MSQEYLKSTITTVIDNASESIPHRFKFSHHLEGLVGEFEFLVEEIESLRKERDEYKARVEMQAEELQGVRCNVVCERCRKNETAITDPRIIASQVKVSGPSSSSRLQSLDKPVSSQGSQQTTMSLSPSTIDSRTTHQSHPQPVMPPSPSSQTLSTNFDPDSGAKQPYNDIQAGKKLNLELTHVLLSHRDRIWCVKFSQDGKLLATGCRNGKTYIYDVQSGILICILRNLLAEHDSIRAVSFSRDGKYLATSSSDTYIYVWEIHTKYVRNAFKGHTDLICSLDFSPKNSQLLVSASYDNTIRLWNTRQSSAWKLLTDENHSFLNYDYYKSAKFSHDEKYVAASHYDGAVRIWDVRLGRLVRRVEAHVDLVNDIAFMPDGKGLVSGGRDMTLKYWDVGSFLDSGSNRRRHFVSRVEELTRLERQFSGHEVSIQFILFPSLQMEDGSLLVRTIKVFVFGTLTLRRWNVSLIVSTMMIMER